MYWSMHRYGRVCFTTEEPLPFVRGCELVKSRREGSRLCKMFWIVSLCQFSVKIILKVKVVWRLWDIQTLCIHYVGISVNRCISCAGGRLRNFKEKERLPEVIFHYRRYLRKENISQWERNFQKSSSIKSQFRFFQDKFKYKIQIYIFLSIARKNHNDFFYKY